MQTQRKTNTRVQLSTDKDSFALLSTSTATRETAKGTETERSRYEEKHRSNTEPTQLRVQSNTSSHAEVVATAMTRPTEKTSSAAKDTEPAEPTGQGDRNDCTHQGTECTKRGNRGYSATAQAEPTTSLGSTDEEEIGQRAHASAAPFKLWQ